MITFVWFYRKNVKDWLTKDDAMQDCIRMVSKQQATNVCVLAEKSEQIRVNGITWFFRQTHQGILDVAKKSSLIISSGPYETTPKLNKLQKNIIYYHHGSTQTLRAQIGSLQQNTYLKSIATNQLTQDIFVSVPIIQAPHGPNLDRFTPQNVPKTIPVLYPTRLHKLKRVDLAKAACAHIGLPLRVESATAPKDMPLLYNQSKCVVLPSISEGGSRVQLEALACNVPVVVCNDCPETVAWVHKFGGIISAPNAQSLGTNIIMAMSLAHDYHTRLKNRDMDNTTLYKNLWPIIKGLL